MTERKPWTQEEDQLLIFLISQQLGKIKWSSVAQQMEFEYNLQGRSGKQCRERYNNHLNQDINKSKITQSEENIIIEEYTKQGNKWAEISKKLIGRTDNMIKNHFYSTLRKSLRRINKQIGDKNSTSLIGEIKPKVLNKLFKIAVQNVRLYQDEQTLKLQKVCKNLQDTIFEFTRQKESSKINKQYSNNQIQDIIDKILELNNIQEKKKKIIKKNSGQKNKNNKKRRTIIDEFDNIQQEDTQIIFIKNQIKKYKPIFKDITNNQLQTSKNNILYYRQQEYTQFIHNNIVNFQEMEMDESDEENIYDLQNYNFTKSFNENTQFIFNYQQMGKYFQDKKQNLSQKNVYNYNTLQDQQQIQEKSEIFNKNQNKFNVSLNSTFQFFKKCEN